MPVGPEKSIFLSALDCASGAQRQAYLAQACGGNRALRKAVDELLAAHDSPRNVLDDGPSGNQRLADNLEGAAAALGIAAIAERSTAAIATLDERTGETIGNYRLMELIGEGGFGQVYVADQQQPVRRRVALKLLKAGMDSREVIARFEAERQALAMMEHPNIARVFDAGSTAAGQPYFVMELVRGVPITTFCDRQHVTTRQKLELFVDVCQAVQHAHQKGVIHRDLKPSNVMVTLHDATPVVKVIDFGVAKAISQPLTDKTLYTRFAQMIGTPMYMSPEQAEMNALDVDTRSDIYALGVLLYELLTGTPPLDKRRIQTATFDELRKIIREEEPPRPSVRVTTLARSMATTATGPRTDARSHAAALRGDLDWIVMKALEKDRRRRYETAADFARDVQRYLDQQPVIARPPSPWYRFSKFARRNKVLFTTASIVLLALVAGTAVSTWQAIRATDAKAEADRLREETEDFSDRLKEANVLLDSARANADQERWPLALAQYTKATELQPDHYLTWSGRGSLYTRLGAWHAAAGDFAKAVELRAPANNPGWWGVPPLFLYAGDKEAYRQICTTLGGQLHQSEDPTFVAFAIRSMLLAPTSPEEASALATRLEESLENSGAAPWGAPPFFGGRPPFDFASPDSRRSPDRDRRPDGQRSASNDESPSGERPNKGDSPNKGDRPPNGERPPNRGQPGGPNQPGGEFRMPRGLPWEVQWYIAGLAHYRAGETEKSLELLRRAAESNPRFSVGRIALPVLAMAYHDAGQAAEADKALSDAAQALDEWTRALYEGSFATLPIPWFDYLECLILYREAHERVRGTPPPADPRLDEIEQRALATLRGE